MKTYLPHPRTTPMGGERRQELHSEEGFTLIELLVVILIIGILAGIVIPMFLNQRKAAHDAAVLSDVRNTAEEFETRNATRQDSPVPGTVIAKPLFIVGAGPSLVSMMVSAQTGKGFQNDFHTSDGTSITVAANDGRGSFCLVGVNPKGDKYSGKPGQYSTWDSRAGGLNRRGGACTDAVLAKFDQPATSNTPAPEQPKPEVPSEEPSTPAPAPSTPAPSTPAPAPSTSTAPPVSGGSTGGGTTTPAGCAPEDAARYVKGKQLPVEAFEVGYLDVRSETMGSARVAKQVQVDMGYKLSAQAIKCGVKKGTSMRGASIGTGNAFLLNSGIRYEGMTGKIIRAEGAAGVVDAVCKKGENGTEACGTTGVGGYDLTGATSTIDNNVTKASLGFKVTVDGYGTTTIYLNGALDGGVSFPHRSNEMSVTAAPSI